MKEAPSTTTTHSMSMCASSADYWKAQAEANAKDAERYRWLRSNGEPDAGMAYQLDGTPGMYDAAIDAAMAGHG